MDQARRLRTRAPFTPRLPPAVFVLSFAVFAAYTGSGMVSVVRVLYVNSHGGSLAIISAMSIAFLAANFAFQYPWGWLADRWGRKQVMVVGLVVQTVLTVAYVFINNPELFIGVRFLEGAAAASVLPAARAAIADLVPDESRGRAYGVFSAFFNLGFLFGPAAGGLLASVGYHWVFAIAATLRFAGAAIVWLFLATPARHAEFREAGETGHGTSLVTLGLLGAYILSFGDYLWIGFDITLVPLWMRHHLGASLPQIGLAYSCWALPAAIITPFGGRLADKHRRSFLIVGAGLGMMPMYAVYVVARSVIPVMIGFAAQACLYAIVSPAVDAHLARSSPARRRGRIQSIFTAVGVAGAFAGATIFVPLYAVDYRIPLVLLGLGYAVFVIVGGAFVFISEKRSPAIRQPGQKHPEPVSVPTTV